MHGERKSLLRSSSSSSSSSSYLFVLPLCLAGVILLAYTAAPASDTVLYSLGMSGPRYEPWAMHSLPRPFDERRPLGLVQYMPDNTTDWYPNQDVGELKLVNGRIVGHEEVENATAGDENATVSETDEAQETVDGEQTEAEESGEGEEVQGEEEQTEEGDGGEPAATKATRTMLKEKATGAYKVLDPADWLKHKMTSTMAAMKKSIKTTNANKRRIPDPIEWMESRYLKHAHGAKVLAGHASGVSSQMRRRQRVIGGHKLHTSKLSQLKSLALKGKFKMASKKSELLALQHAKILGCKGIHYRVEGHSLAAAPCASQAEEFKALKAQRFTRHGDLGTTMKGTREDLGANEFKAMYKGRNLASYADDQFFSSESRVPMSKLNLFGNKADQADDDLLATNGKASRSQQGDRSRKPSHLWHTW